MSSIVLGTKNESETRQVATVLAREVLRTRNGRAFTIGLIGDLGGGKTTFTGGFAKGLGIKKRITSPTFVLMKKFLIPSSKLSVMGYEFFVHIDAYRLNSPRELAALGWKELIRNPRNIIVVEWADKIRRLLPKDAVMIKFRYLKGDEREITIRIKNQEL